jgi:O-antigen/teichoic acid export membrane protein
MMFPATHRQNEWVALLGAALVVNVAANLVLIPRLDYPGAAWATLISEAFTLVIYALLVTRRHAAVLTPGWLIRALLAAGAMGVGVQLVPGPFFARIALGVALFAALSLLLGAVTAEDRAMGRALLRRLSGPPRIEVGGAIP